MSKCRCCGSCMLVARDLPGEHAQVPPHPVHPCHRLWPAAALIGLTMLLLDLPATPATDGNLIERHNTEEQLNVQG